MKLSQLRNILSLRFLSELLNKDLKLIFSANLTGSFGDGLYAYILPYYMANSLVASPTQVGILYASTNVVATLTLLASGLLGDRYDRKKILILGWAFWLPVPLIFAFASNWVQMVPGMALWGVFLGPPVSAAYIVMIAKRDKLTLTFAAVSSAFSLGYIFSPALGGYLVGAAGMQPVFFLAFVFYALASILLFFIRSQVPTRKAETALEKKESRLGLLRNRRLLGLSVFMGLAMFTMFLFRPFMPTFLANVYGYNEFQIGVLGSFTFFGSAVLAIGLGRLGDKFRKSYALAAALALVGFSLVLLLLSGDFRILLVTSLLVGASFLSFPLMGAIIGPQAPESARAFSVAIPLVVGMLGSIFAPYLGGALYEVSPYYPFVFGIAGTLALAVFAFAVLD
jgi:MFS family permease